jgi:hypothetical protein
MQRVAFGRRISNVADHVLPAAQGTNRHGPYYARHFTKRLQHGLGDRDGIAVVAHH